MSKKTANKADLIAKVLEANAALQACYKQVDAAKQAMDAADAQRKQALAKLVLDLGLYNANERPQIPRYFRLPEGSVVEVKDGQVFLLEVEQL